MGTSACYWKDSTGFALPSSEGKGEAHSITGKNGELYIAGHEDKGGKLCALVWKGNDPYYSQGELTKLTAVLNEGSALYTAGQMDTGSDKGAAIADITNKDAPIIALLNKKDSTKNNVLVYGLCASGDTIYAAGTIDNQNHTQTSVLWTINTALNEVPTETVLDNGGGVPDAKGVCFFGGTIYVAGSNSENKAVVWEINTEPSLIVKSATVLETSLSAANTICTAGDSVFIGGFSSVNGKPCIWKGKDGAFTRIELSDKDGAVNAFQVYGSSIYAAGDVGNAVYWKMPLTVTGLTDVEETILPHGNSAAYGIFVTKE
ncbi:MULTISPECIES: hypothetical protein [unclassified Treponema]|uniref:hypothetical protein n=1 Tax=unclassified Treponema TaxID=2638727 RepID=UPI0020A3EFB0|nr:MULTISPECIES: hypothetical protein [unclassified Treponema]UTC67538.1 hypothetical protein E4O06_02370 [Treponema sp. OMZ 789]UTC70266.1 hypothetical protein E4O01_02360 [Treponema sp. OMZ 790]UTC72981.1 hypothetical protein E4O02_02360 [Treponema sp. OMZ 791]